MKFKAHPLKKPLSVLYRYFLSYILILLLPVIFFSYLLYESRVVDLELALDQKYTQSIAQVKTKFDYLSSELLNLSLNFGSQYDIEQLITATSEQTIPPDTTEQIIQSIQEQIVPSPEIFLFGKGVDCIATAEDVISYEEFESIVSTQYEMTITNFYTKMNSATSQIILPTNKSTHLAETNGLFFISPLPYLNHLTDGSMIFFYSSEAINTMLENYLGEITCNVLIFDPSYSLLYNSALNDAAPLTDEALITHIKRLKGTNVFRLQGTTSQEYIVVKTASEASDMFFCFVMEPNVAYEQVLSEKTNFYRLVLICSIIGLLIVLLLTFYNFSPVKKLLVKAGVSNKTRGEFHALNNILDEYSDLKQQLLQSTPLIVNRCIEHILLTEKTQSELNYYLQCARIRFNQPLFNVLYIHIPSINASLDKALAPITALRRSDTTAFAIEVFGEKNAIAILLNYAETTQTQNQTPQNYVNALFDMLCEELQCIPQIGIGEPSDVLTKCSQSLIKAKTACEFCDEQNHIKVYTEIEHSFSEDAYPVIEYAFLTQSIRYGNIESMTTACNDIIATIKAKAPSLFIMKYLFIELLRTLLTLSEKLELPYNTDDITRQFLRYETVQEHEAVIREISNNMCKEVANRKSNKYVHLKTNILSYLSEYYSQNDLSLTSVANHFNISVSSLSKIVYNETGLKFSQYITMLRIEQAKFFLAKTDLKIKDIVEKIGYLDTSNFIRKFKGVEGLTPNQYREENTLH